MKQALAQLTKNLTRSQRINIVFAGWKPTADELKDLRANLPDEYVPAVASKRFADGSDVFDATGISSGLVQHQPSHYTGTDPTNPNVLPPGIAENSFGALSTTAVPYFEPMKFNLRYHFLEADDTYTKDLFQAAKSATQQNHDPGPMGVYATSQSLPENYKALYLSKYNARFGAFRGSAHVVTDTQKW